eukprot:COSAG05_NODE_1690_length_4271_cov_1.395254_3_plen_673_part_00
MRSSVFARSHLSCLLLPRSARYETPSKWAIGIKESATPELCRTIFPDSASVTSSPGNDALVNPSPSHESVLTPWRDTAVKREPLKRVGDSQVATLKAQRLKAFARRQQGHAVPGHSGTAPRCRGSVAGSHTTPLQKQQVEHYSPGEAETLEPKTRHRVLQEMAKVKGLQTKAWQSGMMKAGSAGAEAEAGPLSLPDKRARDALFKRMDLSGNGTLSLAEIHKAVKELWPQFSNKPALMRAYMAADASGDGWIGRREFKLLLEYTEYFHRLWHKFEAIDSNSDRRLSLHEFVAACTAVGHQLSLVEASREFNKVDKDGGGYVLFDEFCAWCAARQVASADAGPAPSSAAEAQSLYAHVLTATAARFCDSRAQVLRLLACGADVRTRHHSQSALCKAVRGGGSFDFIKELLLVEGGADELQLLLAQIRLNWAKVATRALAGRAALSMQLVSRVATVLTPASNDSQVVKCALTFLPEWVAERRDGAAATATTAQTPDAWGEHGSSDEAAIPHFMATTQQFNRRYRRTPWRQQAKQVNATGAATLPTDVRQLSVMIHHPAAKSDKTGKTGEVKQQQAQLPSPGGERTPPTVRAAKAKIAKVLPHAAALAAFQASAAAAAAAAGPTHARPLEAFWLPGAKGEHHNKLRETTILTPSKQIHPQSAALWHSSTPVDRAN